MKFWVLFFEEYNNVSLFKDSNLEQCLNVNVATFANNLVYLKDIYHCDTIELGFLKSHDELNEMRKERGLQKLPTYTNYIKN